MQRDAVNLISVPSSGRLTLQAAARACPPFEDVGLYVCDQQLALRDAVRATIPVLFDEIEGQIKNRLLTPPYLALVRGLPGDMATPLLVAFSCGLGELVEPYRRPWSRVVRHILPATDRAVDGKTLNEFLHTDGTDWAIPNDYTCLFCVRPDQSDGGRSRLLNVNSLIDELADSGQRELLERLASEPMPWRIAEELGGGVYWQPVLAHDPHRVRWLRYTVMLALREGLANITSEQQHLLLAFERRIEASHSIVDIALLGGDMLLIDNRRCLHARTPVADPLTSRRELRRTKVARIVTD